MKIPTSLSQPCACLVLTACAVLSTLSLCAQPGPGPDLPPPEEVVVEALRTNAVDAEGAASETNAASKTNTTPSPAAPPVSDGPALPENLPADAAVPMPEASTPEPAPAPATARPSASGYSAENPSSSHTYSRRLSRIAAVETATNATAAADGKGLQMNFRGVPLETVLNYMSDAAGFIIHPKVDVRGKVDVWSAQPLSKEEAVKLLKQILNENGFTAIQDGRTLTIIRSEDAKKDAIPVISGNDPDKVPKNADIVTQIIPVRTLNATQVIKSLDSLKPSSATLTADEAANSIVMTDTQANIRHFMEIVKGLDSVTSTGTGIKVFPLRYADAKTVASLIKDLFPNPDANKNNSAGGGFGRFRGFGGGFNPFGGGGSGSESTDSNKAIAVKVNAVSDDRSNALIVSAPDEVLPTIGELVDAVDKKVEDETEVKLFHLKNADPTEMADLLGSLFADESTNNAAGNQSPFRFGPFGGFNQQNNNSNASSDRFKKASKVTAVADRRTATLVVTTGRALMPQVSALVEELDARRDRKQTAHVIPLSNADPADVQSILQELFPSSTTSTSSRSGSSSTSSSQNYLLNRAQTQLQQQNSSTSVNGFGSFGNSSSGRGF